MAEAKARANRLPAANLLPCAEGRGVRGEGERA